MEDVWFCFNTCCLGKLRSTFTFSERKLLIYICTHILKVTSFCLNRIRNWIAVFIIFYTILKTLKKHSKIYFAPSETISGKRRGSVLVERRGQVQHFRRSLTVSQICISLPLESDPEILFQHHFYLRLFYLK